MLCANRSITIINRYYDGTADEDIDVSTKLSDVSVYFDRAGTASSNGVTSTDMVKIRIPYRKGYLPEDQWLDRRKNSQYCTAWTLRLGDTVIVDGVEKTILRCRDNTGQKLHPHWYVEAR